MSVSDESFIDFYRGNLLGNGPKYLNTLFSLELFSRFMKCVSRESRMCHKKQNIQISFLDAYMSLNHTVYFALRFKAWIFTFIL